MITTPTTTAAVDVVSPLTLLGATDVDACSGESCAIRPKTSTTP
jgi:hypothetical protein